jgi:hypothetical protein
VSGLIGREIAASCLDRLMIKIKTACRNLTLNLLLPNDTAIGPQEAPAIAGAYLELWRL